MLAVGSKPGGPFTRVDKDTYTLANIASTTTKPAQKKPEAVKRTPARKRAPAQKKTTPTTKQPRTKRSR